TQTSQKPTLKLSDSLQKLDQLSPPSPITTPSPANGRDFPAPPPPKPIPDSISPPPTPQFQDLDNRFSKQTNLRAKPEPHTLFDETPQLAEVRTYFQSRWNPPENLNQDIEYQLIISPDGLLETVIPFGTTAQTYFTQLPFPALNQPFVSASPSQTSQKIRLVFRPSGQIKTFLVNEN
ncbi:MAG: hypothetical protein RI580_03215, partial [Halothece sp. Uz-M2-17]|nr:hypothetical protein [Halothece sp. Uz-M2-17]